MGSRQHDIGCASVEDNVIGTLPLPPALAVAPCRSEAVPPSAIAEMDNEFAMRAAAALTTRPGTLETDLCRELAPVVAEIGRTTDMNRRPLLSSVLTGLNGRLWSNTATLLAGCHPSVKQLPTFDHQNHAQHSQADSKVSYGKRCGRAVVRLPDKRAYDDRPDAGDEALERRGGTCDMPNRHHRHSAKVRAAQADAQLRKSRRRDHRDANWNSRLKQDEPHRAIEHEHPHLNYCSWRTAPEAVS